MESRTEAQVQDRIRLLTNQTDGYLWRNNSGAAKDHTGRMIRYGLGNDSRQLNAKFKSSDLIGIIPLRIEPRHVGRVWGVFTAIEVKRGDWKYKAIPREIAQFNFIQAVRAKGGLATFVNQENQYLDMVRGFLR